MNVLPLISLVVATSLSAFAMAADSPRRPSPSLASLPAPAAAGPLRILLVDDDYSDNNHYPSDSRVSPSDGVFRKLVADAVGGNAKAWSIEAVKPYASGPGIERLRPFSLIVWYTAAIYGGNPDNTGVLSIEDEKTLRQYLQEVGGAVILISPGYVSKVQGASGTWEKTDWPFLKEVLGIRGGLGIAQRFQPGTVTATDGRQFSVGKGGPVETQFSLLNPGVARVLFTTVPSAAKAGSQPVPVATANAYGRGRIVYVGFTFENLAEADLAPAFQTLLAASGVQANATMSVSRPAPATKRQAAGAPTSSPDAEPASVQVSGTPAMAVVSWTLQTATVMNAQIGGAQQTTRSAPPNPAATHTPSVKVERLVPNGAPVALAIASPDASRATDTGPFAPGRAVTYRVTLTDAQGRVGFKEASFTPIAKDPESLSASVQADGSIVLSWPEVPGVSSYEIKSSDRRLAPVMVRGATEWRSPRLDPSPRRWTVNSLYEPGGSLTSPNGRPFAETKGTSSAGLPTPRVPFLSMPNGAGSHAASQAHYRTRCVDALMPGSLCTAAGFIRDATNWEQAWHAGGAAAKNDRPLWPVAAFNNTLDLGTSRRVNCAPRKNGRTVCWATSHATAHTTMPNSLTLIVMEDDKAFFGNWEYAGAELPKEEDFFSRGGWGDDKRLDMEHNFANHASLTSGAALDSQGRKGVPHACLSCHGGTYNPITKQVVGSSLLPLVPARLAFPSQSRSGEEESVRRINAIILQSNPAPAIVDQIHAMYNGTPGTPGTTVNDTAVPAGWTEQPGLYRQVVMPYCASCHFAQRGPMNFRSWGNMLQNKHAVQRTVCTEFTMPHSEILFRRFWTEGGAVSLPGMLSTALGFNTCRQ